MTEKLKPCPFCGEEVSVCIDDIEPLEPRYGIMCPSPECGFWGWFEDEEEAVRGWNNRTSIFRRLKNFVVLAWNRRVHHDTD